MPITSRPYSNADLHSIEQVTARWIEAAGFLGCMNPGDIALRLHNGMRRYDPRDIVRLWLDDEVIVGWALLYPAWHSFETQLHPDYRAHSLAMEMLDWAERETIRLLPASSDQPPTLEQDVYDGDAARIVLLAHRGYTRGDHRGTISVRSLNDPLPDPQLPQDFSIRRVQGIDEAGKLVTLINASFGWHWTVEAYQGVMRNLGFDGENELVVVSPDGRFAASCILLPDAYNRTGMFENVGTHPDFRRMGLAQALLIAGMHRMKSQGFLTAMVPHQADPGLPAPMLYRSLGFQPTYRIIRYSKVF